MFIKVEAVFPHLLVCFGNLTFYFMAFVNKFFLHVLAPLPPMDQLQ